LTDCVPGTFGDVVFAFPGLTLGAGTQYALVLKAVNGTGDIVWRRGSTPFIPAPRSLSLETENLRPAPGTRKTN